MASRPQLSDPQTRDINALFNFLDRDGDGHITSAAALKICERLGYHVDKSDLRKPGVPALLTLPDVLGWCEAYAEKCERSDELRLVQLFSLLHKKRNVHNRNLPAASRLTPVVTKRDLRDYLQSEQHSVDPVVLSYFVEEVRHPPGTDRPSPH